MKRETRFFTLLALGSTMAFSGVAQAQPQGMPPEAMARMQAAQNGQAAQGGQAGGASTAPGAGVVTNQTTTTESTTVAPATDVMTETTTYEEAPLENTGGEPMLFVLGGALLAGSALVMRRRLGNEVQ